MLLGCNPDGLQGLFETKCFGHRILIREKSSSIKITDNVGTVL
jgi:hypothetical protein